MKVGIFLTSQHPPDSDIVAGLEGRYAMRRLARDCGRDAVATGHRNDRSERRGKQAWNRKTVEHDFLLADLQPAARSL